MFDAIVPMVVLFVLLAMSVLIAVEIGQIYKRLKTLDGKVDGVKKQVKFANKRFKSLEGRLSGQISEEAREKIAEKIVQAIHEELKGVKRIAK